MARSRTKSSAAGHAERVDRLARYRAGKQGQPLEVARRWAAALTEQESLELVELVDRIERRQAEQVPEAESAGDPAVEADVEHVEQAHAARRRDLGKLGARFRRRLDAIADRLAGAERQTSNVERPTSNQRKGSDGHGDEDQTGDGRPAEAA